MKLKKESHLSLTGCAVPRMLQNHWFSVKLQFLSQRKIWWPFDTENKRLRSRLNTTQRQNE